MPRQENLDSSLEVKRRVLRICAKFGKTSKGVFLSRHKLQCINITPFRLIVSTIEDSNFINSP